jgi:uncharacterized protein YutE (UPF0331/DUF86 family)
MYDIQRVGRIISDIGKYLKELESYAIKSISDLEDSKNFNASSMVVFAVLNWIIDLGNEVISAEELGAPNTYQDIMPLLVKANVIIKAQSDQLNKLIRKRNVLAHFYEDISKKELYELIKDITLVSDFVKIVKNRVKID